MVKLLDAGVYRCKKCGNKERIKQSGKYVKAPIKCANCGVEGPFEMMCNEKYFR